MEIARGMGVSVGGRGVAVGGIGVALANIDGILGAFTEQAVRASKNSNSVRFIENITRLYLTLCFFEPEDCLTTTGLVPRLSVVHPVLTTERCAE